MRMLLTGAATAAALFSAATPAFAEVVVLTQTVGNDVAPNASTVSFAKFDQSLGVLTSVTLAFTAGSSTTVNFSNNTPNSRTWDIDQQTTASVTGNGFSLSDTYKLDNDTFTLAARISNQTPRTGTKTYTASYADDATLTSSLSAFAGAGVVDFSFGRAAQFMTSPTASVLPTSFNGSVTLTYNYDLLPAAVPEPAAWAMMIGGFALVGAASRRRARASVTFA
jgi:PEP-CTERM motif